MLLLNTIAVLFTERLTKFLQWITCKLSLVSCDLYWQTFIQLFTVDQTCFTDDRLLVSMSQNASMYYHALWLSAELGCQPSATGLFRLLPLVSGTICHRTSLLQNLCLSSAVTLRLISLGAAFRDTLTVVMPEKWLCHSGHVNRFCYLLTYFETPCQSCWEIKSEYLNSLVWECILACVLCVPVCMKVSGQRDRVWQVEGTRQRTSS